MITWKEFKAMCESRGMTDDSKIGYIDITGVELPETTEVENRGEIEGWTVWN